MKDLFPIAACIAAGITSAASAATFDSRTDFLAQPGSFVEHSSIDADFSVSAPAGSWRATPTTTYTNLYSPDAALVLSGPENFNLDVTFASEIYAFGMDVYEPVRSYPTLNGCNVATCVESTFEISFLSGATVIETITFAPENALLDFIGFTSVTAFDRVEVRETVGTNDNEFFGNFVTSTSPVSAVPLPAGLPLVLAGVGMLGLARRAQRR